MSEAVTAGCVTRSLLGSSAGGRGDVRRPGWKAVGELSGEVVGSADVGIPIRAGRSALLPAAVSVVGEGLGIRPTRALTWRTRGAHQNVNTCRVALAPDRNVEAYARGIASDNRRSEEAMRDLVLESAGAQEARTAACSSRRRRRARRAARMRRRWRWSRPGGTKSYIRRPEPPAASACAKSVGAGERRADRRRASPPRRPRAASASNARGGGAVGGAACRSRRRRT